MKGRVSILGASLCPRINRSRTRHDRARSLEKGFTYDDVKEPHAFVQWKGTDVCMDFRCECGANCHFDGGFAYTVKCPHCETVWEMPWNIFPRKANDQTD